jgi:thiol-disulfide isomerase/thioredoxin
MLRHLGLLLLLISSLSVQAEMLDLSPYKGKVVYLDFWASWCSPCLASFPWMNKLHKDLQAQGFEIIAVNVDAEHAAAQKFIQQHPVDFEIIFDPQGKLAEAHKVMGMPSSFLYGRDGKLLSSHIGFSNKKTDQLRAAIEAALQ